MFIVWWTVRYFIWFSWRCGFGSSDSDAYFALRWGGGHFTHVLLIFGVSGVLCQFIKHVCAWSIGDVQIVSQGGAVRGGAGEGVLLIGLLWKEIHTHIFQLCWQLDRHERTVQVELLKVNAIPSRLLREITVSRSTPRISPILFTMAVSLMGYTATWSPDSYLHKHFRSNQ